MLVSDFLFNLTTPRLSDHDAIRPCQLSAGYLSLNLSISSCVYAWLMANVDFLSFYPSMVFPRVSLSIFLEILISRKIEI